MYALADVFFDLLDTKSKAQKKKGNNSKPTSLNCEISQMSPTMAGARKTQLKKEDISYPIHPFRNCLRIEPANFADIKGKRFKTSYRFIFCLMYLVFLNAWIMARELQNISTMHCGC